MCFDVRQEGAFYRRIEVITGQLRWTAHEKTRIVAESFEEGPIFPRVARRGGAVRGLRCGDTVHKLRLPQASMCQARCRS
jgi:hypothetical protein